MRLAAAAVLLLGLAGAAHAEAPEVEAASDTIAVLRPLPVARTPDIAVHGRRPSRNSVAGVPGTVVIVSFPPGSAELDERQMRALWRLTRWPRLANWPSTLTRPALIQASISRREPSPMRARTFCSFSPAGLAAVSLDSFMLGTSRCIKASSATPAGCTTRWRIIRTCIICRRYR